MKICITSTGDGPGAEVDPRFGRAEYFAIVDTDTESFDFIENPALQASGGAGVQSAQFVVERGVTAVLTGNVGPNAYKILNAGKVEVYTSVQGTVEKALADFKNGDLSNQRTDAPTVKGK